MRCGCSFCAGMTGSEMMGSTFNVRRNPIQSKPCISCGDPIWGRRKKCPRCMHHSIKSKYSIKSKLIPLAIKEKILELCWNFSLSYKDIVEIIKQQYDYVVMRQEVSLICRGEKIRERAGGPRFKDARRLRRHNPRPLSEKRKQAIELCKTTNKSYVEIAAELGVSTKSVSSWCVEAGARQRTKRQKLTIRQRERLYPHRTSPLRQQMKDRWSRQATPSSWPKPEVDIEKARKMLKAGASYAEIALELGISWNEARRLKYRRNADRDIRGSMRQFSSGGDFADIARYARAQARAGVLDQEAVEAFVSQNWGRFYVLRERIIAPEGLPLLTYLYTLPDDLEVNYTTVDQWGNEHNHRNTIKSIRSHSLIHSIAQAGGHEFLTALIQPVQRQYLEGLPRNHHRNRHPLELEITHAIHAVSNLPGLPSDELLTSLEEVVRRGLPGHAQGAAQQLAVVSTPRSIEAMRDRIIDHEGLAGWTPISVMQAMAILGGVDALMDVVSANLVHGILEYGAREIAHAVVLHRPQRTDEAIALLQDIAQDVRNMSSEERAALGITYHDDTGLREAIGYLSRHPQAPNVSLDGYELTHVPGQWNIGQFWDMYQRRRRYWKERRQLRRRRERGIRR